MNKGNIEFVQGKEQHTSTWGKFYIKGLDDWQVKEDFDENRQDNHHSYQGYVCLDVPEDTVFTIFEQSGDKHGTDAFHFIICRIATGNVYTINADYGKGKCIGNYEIVSQGNTKTKAPRLMNWWNAKGERPALEYARLCAKYIDKRGVKELPES